MSGVFITGCGRSGTSMVAGLFAQTGLFMGDDLHSPRHSNPKGFFEAPAINRFNDRLIVEKLPSRIQFEEVEYGGDIPRPTHGWLARLPMHCDIVFSDRDAEEARNIVGGRSFCFKDPRFCYTIDGWLNAVPGTHRLIFVFRQPEIVVESILAEMRSTPYLYSLAMGVDQLFQYWEIMAKRMLRFAQDSRALFVSYDAVLNSEVIDAMEDLTGLKLDRSFPEVALKRSSTSLVAPPTVATVFDELRRCEQTSIARVGHAYR